MSGYLDRLRELVYVSPSGREFRPLWDDLERSGGKKAAVSEVPQANGAITQDLGNKAREYKLAVYFSGADYDRAADAFVSSLSERGPAKLRHPVWGNLDVLALSWSESRGFVDGMGRASFSLDLVEAPPLSSLTSTATTAAAIQSAAESAAATASSVYEVSASNASDLAKTKDRIRRRVKETYRKMANLTAQIESKRRDIEALGKSIERGLDTAIETPLALAQSIISLSRAPARAAISIKAKVDGYAGLIVDAASGLAAIPLSVAEAAGLDLAGLLLGLLESVTAGTLASRADATATASRIEAAIAQALAAIEFMEATVPGYVPDAGLLALIASLRAQVAGYLLESAYSLPSERRVLLDGDATPLELAVRFYGSPDEADRVISENGLEGDCIFVVPAGSEVRFYA